MDFIRQHLFTKVTAFIAGVAFLNMSFFLAEVSLLKFEKKDLIENIAKLILNTGFEEERDGGSSHESGVKETLLGQQVQIHSTSSILISTNIRCILVNHYLHANYALKFFPPPDVFLFS
jgi:hypothetical protein